MTTLKDITSYLIDVWGYDNDLSFNSRHDALLELDTLDDCQLVDVKKDCIAYSQILNNQPKELLSCQL